MGFFIAVIALALGLFFQYEKVIFNEQTLIGLKEFVIAVL